MSSSVPFTMLPSSSSPTSSSSSFSSSSVASSISYSSLLRESRNRRAKKNEGHNETQKNQFNAPTIGHGFVPVPPANLDRTNSSSARHGDDIEMKETRVAILNDDEGHRRNDSRSTPNLEDGHDSSLLVPSRRAATSLLTPGYDSPTLQPDGLPGSAAIASSSSASSSSSSSSSSLAIPPPSNASALSSSPAPVGGLAEDVNDGASFGRGAARGCAYCFLRVCSPMALKRIYPLVFGLLLLSCAVLFIQGQVIAGVAILCFTCIFLLLYCFRLWIFYRWGDRPLTRALSGVDYQNVDQLFEDDDRRGRRGRSRWFASTAFRLAAVDRDFTANDYEMLLRLDEENGAPRRGMHQSQIERLPQFVLKKSLTNADESKTNTDEESNCSICLDAKKQGDTLRGLPCMHSFHRECVDKWLRRKNVCPTCRLPVNLERGSFFSPSNAALTASDASMSSAAVASSSSSSSDSATSLSAAAIAGSEWRNALGDLNMEEFEALQEAIAMEQSLREAAAQSTTTPGQA